MRSLNNYAPVEGHVTLVRDMSSNAILTTGDDAAYNAYKMRREIEKRRQLTIDSQVEEIQSLKNEMLEIKQMLSQLLSAKGH